MTEGIFVPMEAVQVVFFGALMVASAILLGMEIENDYPDDGAIVTLAIGVIWWWFVLAWVVSA